MSHGMQVGSLSLYFLQVSQEKGEKKELQAVPTLGLFPSSQGFEPKMNIIPVLMSHNSE